MSIKTQRAGSTRDIFNFYFGELLAVTVFLAVAFAAFLVKHDDFVTLYVADNAHLDTGSFDIWLADADVAIIINEVYGVEREGISFIRCQPVDEDLLTLLNFELLTGDGNYCKHRCKSMICVKK
jgi:hypothetical protein